MSNFFHVVFYLPIEQILLFFYHLTGDNFGLAIILLTVVIRIVLIPLSLPSLKSAEKIKVIKPDLDDLKIKHKNDPKKLQEEQLSLYKQHGINPAMGCLPMLLQLPILIFLYRVLLDQLGRGGVNSNFWIFDLSQPDTFFILPVLASVTQFIFSYMISPSKGETGNKVLTEKKEEDFAESLSSALQTQNLYIMPVLWFFILLKLPSGIGIYWVVSTLFSIVQQFIFVGPGRFKDLFLFINSKSTKE